MFLLTLSVIYGLGSWVAPLNTPIAPAALVGSAAASRPVLATWLLATIGSVILLSAGPLTAKWAKLADSNGKRTLDELELSSVWTGLADTQSQWQPHFIGAATEARRSYVRKDGKRIDLYVALYTDQMEGRELVNEMNTVYQRKLWAVGNVQRLPSSITKSDRRDVQETYLNSRLYGSRLVWHWYIVGRYEAVSALEAKLLHIWRLLTGDKAEGVVAISAPFNLDPGEARTVLADFLWLPVDKMIRGNDDKVAHGLTEVTP